MGERDTVWQEPGYNGLCNYAQKITSCFGLDGKTQGKEEDGGGWMWMWGAEIPEAVKCLGCILIVMLISPCAWRAVLFSRACMR